MEIGQRRTTEQWQQPRHIWLWRWTNNKQCRAPLALLTSVIVKSEPIAGSSHVMNREYCRGINTSVQNVLFLLHVLAQPSLRAASQHILNIITSLEIRRVMAGRASGVKIPWGAWLGLLSLLDICLCRPASSHTVRHEWEWEGNWASIKELGSCPHVPYYFLSAVSPTLEQDCEGRLGELVRNYRTMRDRVVYWVTIMFLGVRSGADSPTFSQIIGC